LIIPTIVLAEALIREPEDNHAKMVETAHRDFIVVDFDSRCSMQYGRMLRGEKWEEAKETQRKHGIVREKMKLDHMIVCCGIVNGANAIFSEDSDVVKFARGHLQVRSITEMAIQANLF
jgi:hypothetical protein